MVQSRAADVDTFLAEVDPVRRPALERIRALCRENFSGWEERMQWGMPGYGPPGEDARISFNNQKQYIALYAGAQALDAHRDRLAKASLGKGCIRFARPEAIDFDLVADILGFAYRAKKAN